MLNAYARPSGAIELIPIDAATVPDTVLWIDMLEPSPEEEDLVERLLGIDVPTREEMGEIELSSRLYHEGAAAFMTAMILSRVDSDAPLLLPVTFILAGNCLVTVRYSDPLPFRMFSAQAQRPGTTYLTREDVLAGLLVSIVDRIADILETVQHEMDTLSSRIFAKGRAPWRSQLRGGAARHRQGAGADVARARKPRQHRPVAVLRHEARREGGEGRDADAEDAVP